jgi:hypothetical protein
MIKLVYKPPKEKYGFILFPAKFGDKWDKIPDDKHLFIHYSDFEHIIAAIKSIYPVTRPDTNDTEEEFDVCGMNWIHNQAWSEITSKLQSDVYEDAELKRFVDDFCAWIAENQIGSDEIMVQGTL